MPQCQAGKGTTSLWDLRTAGTGQCLRFPFCVSAVVNQATAKLKPGQTTPTMTLAPLLILFNILMHVFHFFNGLRYIWLCSASLIACCFTAELGAAAEGAGWRKQSRRKDLGGLVSSGRAYFHVQFSCQENSDPEELCIPLFNPLF